MKVLDWMKKFRIALVAAGIWVPGFVCAQDIPLGDASFDDFVVPAAVGYAYSDTYRPTSAWVDDLDHAAGYYYEDDGNSNWLYDSNYDSTRRPAPRTGNQAMHGLGYYNAQEPTGAVFEANKTYTFSVWAQGDSDATDSSSRVWMYIFDGSEPFLEATSLVFARYAPDTGDFFNRVEGSTQNESAANWTQISLSWTVKEGAAEIGNPIGVGLWIAGDGAVEDATLTTGEDCLLGDVDQNGVVNLLDVTPFIALITDGLNQCEGDINQDGAVDLLDVAPFVDILSGGG